MAHLRAGAVESGCDVNCDDGDAGDVRRAATNGAGISADAQGCGRIVDGRGWPNSGWLLCNNRRHDDSGGSSWL